MASPTNVVTGVLLLLSGSCALVMGLIVLVNQPKATLFRLTSAAAACCCDGFTRRGRQSARGARLVASADRPGRASAECPRKPVLQRLTASGQLDCTSRAAVTAFATCADGPTAHKPLAKQSASSARARGWAYNGLSYGSSTEHTRALGRWLFSNAIIPGRHQARDRNPSPARTPFLDFTSSGQATRIGDVTSVT